MNLFAKYTKWEPVLIHDFSGSGYILLCRMNLKTGELCFKDKKMNSSFATLYGMPTSIFDPKIQFDKILNTKADD